MVYLIGLVHLSYMGLLVMVGALIYLGFLKMDGSLAGVGFLGPSSSLISNGLLLAKGLWLKFKLHSPTCQDFFCRFLKINFRERKTLSWPGFLKLFGSLLGFGFLLIYDLSKF